MTAETLPVSAEDVLAAAGVVFPYLHRTPLIHSTTLSTMTGCSLTLKAENLQKTGSFKARGALNALSLLSPAQRRRGVITVSAGNHGIALSFAGQRCETKATVVMPDGAPKSKIAAIETYGGRPVLVDGTRLMEEMEVIRGEEGQEFIHPFDNPHVIAGQGTVGLEICDDVENVEVLVVPVGGGGLISGIATWVKARFPHIRIVGVEPEGSDAVSKSLAAGMPVRLSRFGTVADGLNAPWGGVNSLSIISQLVDEVITISDEDIVAALRIVLERMKLLTEPAGAAAVGALLKRMVPGVAGRNVVAVLSGGNVDHARLAAFLQ